jgi:GNAT superfamily N-acetyltransferase
MVDSEEITVASAGLDRLSVLARVFGNAFVDEPMMRWPLGDHGDLTDRFTRCFSYFFEEVLDQGIVWEAGAGMGGAVWIPPHFFDAVEPHPWNQPRIYDLTDDHGRRYASFWRWVDSHTPDEPLWLLDSIAVDPTVQGRGYGATLIAAGLARARADGRGAFLSTATPRNVTIYSRCGFRVVEDANALGTGPHVWFMRWDP